MQFNKEANIRVGLKSSLRALKDGCAEKIILAEDCDQHVSRQLIELAKEKEVAIEYVDTMKTLGQLCEIDVGAAAAVIIK